jgi:hypothetical protein
VKILVPTDSVMRHPELAKDPARSGCETWRGSHAVRARSFTTQVVQDDAGDGGHIRTEVIPPGTHGWHVKCIDR